MIVSMLTFKVVALRSSILSTFMPFRTLIFLPFLEIEGESPCLHYMVHIIIFLVLMFYANMYTIYVGHSFWVTMFGQSFLITSLLVKCGLDMPRLDPCLIYFLPGFSLSLLASFFLFPFHYIVLFESFLPIFL